MQFAIAIPTDADSWRLVRRAEELGFCRAWFYDTQMLSADPFVAMAAAAVKTTRIRLGTGVLIPSNRIAAVAANAFASLNKLAPGRIDFGVGTGFTGRRAMGLGAIRLADMEEYTRIVMELLREETVEAEIEGKRRAIRLLNPDLGLINTRDPIGLHIAASGPRGRALVAKLGTGWINTAGDVTGSLAAINDMQARWRSAGRGTERSPRWGLLAERFWRRVSPPTHRGRLRKPVPAPRCCCTGPPIRRWPVSQTLHRSRRPSARWWRAMSRRHGILNRRVRRI